MWELKSFYVYLKGRNDAVLVCAEKYMAAALPDPFCDSALEFYDASGAKVASFYMSHVQGVVG